MAIINEQWSKYEIYVSTHKYYDVQDLDKDELQIDHLDTDKFEPLVPISVRRQYLDAYYQIQKYAYLENLADHKEFVEKAWYDHVHKYAIENAGRILRGEKSYWQAFIAPNRPFLK